MKQAQWKPRKVEKMKRKNVRDVRQLVRAISRLYRRRFLQPNTRCSAFFRDLQDYQSFASKKLNTLVNFRQLFSNFCKHVQEGLQSIALQT